jgi:hypothetical protein
MGLERKFESDLAFADLMAVLALHLLKKPVQEYGDLINQSFPYSFEIYTLTEPIEIALRQLESSQFLSIVCQLSEFADRSQLRELGDIIEMSAVSYHDTILPHTSSPLWAFYLIKFVINAYDLPKKIINVAHLVFLVLLALLDVEDHERIENFFISTHLVEICSGCDMTVLRSHVLEMLLCQLHGSKLSIDHQTFSLLMTIRFVLWSYVCTRPLELSFEHLTNAMMNAIFGHFMVLVDAKRLQEFNVTCALR